MMRRLGWVILLIAPCVVHAGGCSSGSTSLLTPTPVGGRCTVSIDKAPGSIPAAGGAGSLALSTDRECQWSLTGQPDWVKFTSPATGQGPAEISYVVDANRSTSQRTMQLTVLGQQVVIPQEGARCAFAVSPTDLTVSAAGEDTRVQLSTEDFCAWAARPLDSWIDLVSSDQGQGKAEILLRIRRNSGDRRVGTLEIAGISVACLSAGGPGGFRASAWPTGANATSSSSTSCSATASPAACRRAACRRVAAACRRATCGAHTAMHLFSGSRQRSTDARKTEVQAHGDDASGVPRSGHGVGFVAQP